MFGALRGMLRPLLLNQSVTLLFEAPDDLPSVYTDEGKVSQILRNLISNGLKFTERGEVRVTVRLDGANMLIFEVADTGIGIKDEDLPRIFEEFMQLEHRLQRKVRGTGLGLPLSKRLAELLGGTLSVRSELGIGSTFSLRIPTLLQGSTPASSSIGFPNLEKPPYSSSTTPPKRSTSIRRRSALPRSRSIRHERSSKPTTRSARSTRWPSFSTS